MAECGVSSRHSLGSRRGSSRTPHNTRCAVFDWPSSPARCPTAGPAHIHSASSASGASPARIVVYLFHCGISTGVSQHLESKHSRVGAHAELGSVQACVFLLALQAPGG